MNKFALAAYISIFVVMAMEDVGKVERCSNITYTGLLPVQIFILLAIPAVLGYWIGKEGE